MAKVELKEIHTPQPDKVEEMVVLTISKKEAQLLRTILGKRSLGDSTVADTFSLFKALQNCSEFVSTEVNASLGVWSLELR